MNTRQNLALVFALLLACLPACSDDEPSSPGPTLAAIGEACEAIGEACEVLGAACASLRAAIEPKASLGFAIQTNGTILSPAWLEVFSRHRVHVGVSIDVGIGVPLS